jgi:hypothetical protein
MNLAVMPDAWRVTPRYVGYDLMARAHLDVGADTGLAAMCHHATFAEICLRESGRDHVLAERSGSHQRCRQIEASQQWHRNKLRELLMAVAELPSRTDIGLIWKGDTLVHMVEFFEPETLPEIVPLALLYAEEVSKRFACECAARREGASKSALIAADSELVANLERAFQNLQLWDAAATKMRMVLGSGPSGPKEALHRLEADLADRERDVEEGLERVHWFLPTEPGTILSLARLVATVLGSGTQANQHLTVCGLCRNLANAVRRHVAPVLAATRPSQVS